MQQTLKIAGALLIGFACSLPAAGEASFKEPRSDAEWRAFCEAPDYQQKLVAIQDKAQRERVAGVCLRAPWLKFAPSKPKAW